MSRLLQNSLLSVLLVAILVIPIFTVVVMPQHVFAADTSNTTADASCAWFGLSDPGYCLVSKVANFLGAFFLTFGAGVLRIIGYIFDFFVVHGLTNYANTLQDSGFLGSITTGWTVFRDLSNILIIGFFVFIAINIILGTTTYGQKMLIARVILVAVLLNFSLLFTKIIIDTSNFTAYQFYTHMRTSCPGNGNRDETKELGQCDIASAFMSRMGVTGVGDSDVLARVSNAARGSGGNWFTSGILGLFYGILAGFLFLLVAVVLLYGSFLILMRAVALVFVMLLAAPAFVTFLLPSLANAPYGFDRWLRTLLGYAAFAPLVMMFLWISLIIMSAATTKMAVPQNGQLSDIGQVIMGSVSNVSATAPADNITNNPVNNNQSGNPGWTAIWNFALGLAFLGTSFYLAGKIAGSVPGMGLARGLVGGLAGGALGLAAGGGGAVVARGGLALAERARQRGNAKTDEAAAHRARADVFSKAGDKAATETAKKQAERAEKAAGRSLALAGRFASNPNVAAYQKQIDERAKTTAGIASKVTVTTQAVESKIPRAETINAAQEAAGKGPSAYSNAINDRNKLEEGIKELKEQRAQVMNTALQSDAAYSDLDKKREQLEKEKSVLEAERVFKEKSLETITDPEQRKKVREELDSSLEQHRSDMRVRDSDIRRIHEELSDKRRAVLDTNPAVKTQLKDFDTQIVGRTAELQTKRAEVYAMEQPLNEAIATEVAQAPANIATGLATTLGGVGEKITRAVTRDAAGTGARMQEAARTQLQKQVSSKGRQEQVLSDIVKNINTENASK